MKIGRSNSSRCFVLPLKDDLEWELMRDHSQPTEIGNATIRHIREHVIATKGVRAAGAMDPENSVVCGIQYRIAGREFDYAVVAQRSEQVADIGRAWLVVLAGFSEDRNIYRSRPLLSKVISLQRLQKLEWFGGLTQLPNGSTLVHNVG